MPNKPSDEILLNRHVDNHHIAELTINRPDAYNALSLSCMEQMITALRSLAEDTAVRVIILSGSGKGFCAGHDLKELRANPSAAFYRRTFETCARLMHAITESPAPVIARVKGMATAAGCQLVATCDLAIAGNQAFFATPGVNIGLFCSTPMVALSRNLTRKHAMEMLLTGTPVSAARACELGLVNQAVPEDLLDRTVDELADSIASRSTQAIRIGKKAFYRQIDMDLGSAYQYCGQVMVENMMAEDAVEGIEAFLEKRPPQWRGD